MKTLSEIEIISQYTGKEINMEHLKRCAHRNGQGNDPAVYIVYSCGFLYDKELKQLFGVTDKLKDLWERRGTEFNIYMYIADGIISSAKIFKYSESGCARPSIRTPKCTQQELRIAIRILNFVTKGCEEN